MKTLCTLLAVVCLGTVAAADDLERDLERALEHLETLPLAQRQAAVDALLAAHPADPAGPLLLYRGTGRDVRLAGDFTDWQPDVVLHHVPGTDLWTYRFELPDMARVDYKLVRDGQWLLDPRNPRRAVSGFGENSEYAGPAYRPPDRVGRTDLLVCAFDTLQVASPELGDVRTVVVVTPPGATGPYLLVHDGLEYITFADLPGALGRLHELHPAARLPVCVCVPPVLRTEEYATSLQEPFGRFVVETLRPLIETRLGERGAWGSLGASYGGNVSLYLARRYPERFDRVAAMSPAVAPEQHDGVAALDPASLKLYVNWGTYDIRRLIPGCERFAAMLDARGFDHLVEVRPQGHAWFFWRDTLEPALRRLYVD
jgi:enterochelin esterase family protein